MSSPSSAEPRRGALHVIALFEGVKGVAALAASIGLLGLAHHDVKALAYALIGHFHLDPDAHFPRVLLQDASWLADTGLRQVVTLAWAYASIRLLEGYGLWKDRPWAEWLAALSGGIYLPFEARHLAQQPTAINAAVLVGNAAVVGYMVYRLRQRLRAARG